MKGFIDLRLINGSYITCHYSQLYYYNNKWWSIQSDWCVDYTNQEIKELIKQAQL